MKSHLGLIFSVSRAIRAESLKRSALPITRAVVHIFVLLDFEVDDSSKEIFISYCMIDLPGNVYFISDETDGDA